jgi:glycosyltransferase involved in cell wall biosynthesis
MQIVYIGNRLSKWGYTPTSVETLGVRLGELGDVLPYSDKPNPFFRLFDMLLGIWRHRSSVDVVIIDTYSSSAFYFALLCARFCKLLKLAYVPILRGGNLPSRIHQSPRLAYIAFNAAFRLVAPSMYLYQHFIDAGFRQTCIIPNYIDIQNYPYQHRSQPKPKILWVRSFHATYNPNLAIDILVLFLQHYPDAELCMVGPDKDGSMDTFKKYAEEKGVMKHIKLMGKLEKEAWINLSSNYDLFLNTTNFDNTPVSVMEAMALGMLVVSTDAGGVPAIIKHNVDGFIFPCKEATTGAEALIRAMNAVHASGISKKAREKAINWDWQVVKQQWSDLLQEVSGSCKL